MNATNTLIAYHGDPDLKDRILAQIAAHAWAARAARDAFVAASADKLIELLSAATPDVAKLYAGRSDFTEQEMRHLRLLFRVAGAATDADRLKAEESDEKRRQASKLGGEQTQRKYAEALTRKPYAERVGVTVRTVVRWQEAGVLKPRRKKLGAVEAYVFTEQQVAFGRLLAEETRKPGRPTLEQAAARARKRLRAAS